jgi:hypothetical protein
LGQKSLIFNIKQQQKEVNMRTLFCVLVIVLVAFFVLPTNVLAADKVQTITFQWDQPDLTLVKDWELHWGDAPGGPYVEATTFVYTGVPNTTFEGVQELTVSGVPSSTVTKYFVIRACGDVEGETPLRQCSDWSNEVSYGFKIPFGGFNAPVQFRLQATP